VDSILTADRAEYHAGYRLPRDWRTVDIGHLTFTYQDEEKNRLHLKDVSIRLPREGKIALVGESGSGKSTLMALMRGLHTAEAHIQCDGQPLKHGLKHLAPHVTLIPQEPEIFENTIEYNVTLETERSREEVMEDIRTAQFESVLRRLPRGLKTNIAEKGVNLSGGEKQRLALARGVFAAKTSDIILLDEPTSSVDMVNERQIYENVLKKFSDRCIVSSIHKLYLLPFFDYVYVFADGKIVDQGTPREIGARLKR
jgi:ABC-type bacteriocin/lantibiotic exporter with double-glycine peptidase domain